MMARSKELVIDILERELDNEIQELENDYNRTGVKPYDEMLHYAWEIRTALFELYRETIKDPKTLQDKKDYFNVRLKDLRRK